MRFAETKLRGAFIIDIDPIEDQRGFFARSFCRREFEEHGLNPDLAQCNISFNKVKGTLRGMHYQVSPRPESKVVRCTAGTIYDVIIDLRSGSPTFRQWQGFELSADSRRMLYIPAGFAHGFQTLADNSEVFYMMSDFYRKEMMRGVRYDDAAFGITWPLVIQMISDNDVSYGPLEM